MISPGDKVEVGNCGPCSDRDRHALSRYHMLATLPHGRKVRGSTHTMSQSRNGQQARVLILTVHHGSTHVRMARALAQALTQLRPNLKVEVIDTLAHCAGWFRAYYNSYEIPLRYWPALWDFIESRQY